MRFFLAVIASAVFAAPAYAGGGHYTFTGGTKSERATVTAALDASSFDWNRVPRTIEIRIAPDAASEATPGAISLNADLLDAGTLAWGVVQHEYAHQVDFFLLGDAERTQLQSSLGGTAWWQIGGVAHGDLASERFASTLAWAYWPSTQNVMKPTTRGDEAGWIAPDAFRSLVASVLSRGGPAAVPAQVTSKAPILKRRRHR